MKKQPQFSLPIVFCFIFFTLASCVIEPTPTRLPASPTDQPTATSVPATPTEQLDLNLSGMWQVNEIYFDQTINRTFTVEIEQKGKELKILKDGDEIVSCTMNGKELKCTNWEAYGFTVIYIDNPTSMYSELPLVESVNKLEFIKLDE